MFIKFKNIRKIALKFEENIEKIKRHKKWQQEIYNIV